MLTRPHPIPLRRLAEAQNWRCAYCGFTMLSQGYDRHEERAVLGAGRRPSDRRVARRYRVATREHLVPRCDGGSDAGANLVAACAFCNQFRGNRPVEEAARRIRRLIHRGSHPHQVWHRAGVFPKLPGLRPRPSLTPSALPPPASPVCVPADAPVACPLP